MKNREITTAQRTFVDALIDGEGIGNAAVIAGYNPAAAKQRLLGIAVNQKICAYARSVMRGRIDIEASPEAYAIMLLLMRDENSPKGLRVEIAKFFINHSIPAPKATLEGGENEKEPSDMTNTELEQYIKKTDEELVKRGKVIDVTPIQDVDSII